MEQENLVEDLQTGADEWREWKEVKMYKGADGQAVVVSKEPLVIGSYELLTALSYLNRVEDVVSASLVCRSWLEVAREPLLWSSMPIKLKSVYSLRAFFVSLASGVIDYVLPSRKLVIELQYPLKTEAGDEVRCAGSILPCLRKPVVNSWLGLLESLKLSGRSRITSSATPVDGRAKLSENTVLLHIMARCDTLRRLSLYVDSKQAVREFRMLCEKFTTRLVSLKLGSFWEACGGRRATQQNERARADILEGLKRGCKHLQHFRSERTIPGLLHVLRKACYRTLRTLNVESIDCGDEMVGGNTESPERFEVLESLTVGDLCRSEDSAIDLSVAGETVTSLTVNAHNVLAETYPTVNAFLSHFTKLKQLVLGIHGVNGLGRDGHGEGNQAGDDDFQRYMMTLPALSMMHQLTSVQLDIMDSPRLLDYDVPAVLENLTKAPVRQLAVSFDEKYVRGEEKARRNRMFDEIAVTVGRLFAGRLEKVQFFGDGGISEEALRESMLAVDTSLACPVFSARMRNYRVENEDPPSAFTQYRARSVVTASDEVSVYVEWH